MLSNLNLYPSIAIRVFSGLVWGGRTRAHGGNVTLQKNAKHDTRVAIRFSDIAGKNDTKNRWILIGGGLKIGRTGTAH